MFPECQVPALCAYIGDLSVRSCAPGGIDNPKPLHFIPSVWSKETERRRKDIFVMLHLSGSRTVRVAIIQAFPSVSSRKVVDAVSRLQFGGRNKHV
jgi:hypothetical protein